MNGQVLLEIEALDAEEAAVFGVRVRGQVPLEALIAPTGKVVVITPIFVGVQVIRHVDHVRTRASDLALANVTNKLLRRGIVTHVPSEIINGSLFFGEATFEGGGQFWLVFRRF